MNASPIKSDPLIDAKGSQRQRKKLSERRSDLREEYWPNSEAEIWSRKSSDGYATIPRVLPLVAALAKHLAKGSEGDPTSVYMELWSRATDEGIVQIKDEQECAYAAGYTGNRAHRTWKERMGTLVDFGLIKAQPSGNRDYAAILLVNPLRAVVRLKANKKYKVPPEWWAAFKARTDEVGAEVPKIENLL
jgi:hypothetical protein